MDNKQKLTRSLKQSRKVKTAKSEGKDVIFASDGQNASKYTTDASEKTFLGFLQGGLPVISVSRKMTPGNKTT